MHYVWINVCAVLIFCVVMASSHLLVLGMSYLDNYTTKSTIFWNILNYVGAINVLFGNWRMSHCTEIVYIVFNVCMLFYSDMCCQSWPGHS